MIAFFLTPTPARYSSSSSLGWKETLVAFSVSPGPSLDSISAIFFGDTANAVSGAGTISWIASSTGSVDSITLDSATSSDVAPFVAPSVESTTTPVSLSSSTTCCSWSVLSTTELSSALVDERSTAPRAPDTKPVVTVSS